MTSLPSGPALPTNKAVWQAKRFDKTVYAPAKTVSLRLYFSPTLGKSFSFLPVNFNSPLKYASSNNLSKDLVKLSLQVTAHLRHNHRHVTALILLQQRFVGTIYVTSEWHTLRCRLLVRVNSYTCFLYKN